MYPIYPLDSVLFASIFVYHLPNWAFQNLSPTPSDMYRLILHHNFFGYIGDCIANF